MSGERFRIGNKLGRTVYRENPEHPGEGDELIGIMDTREWGQRVVDALNAQERERDERA